MESTKPATVSSSKLGKIHHSSRTQPSEDLDRLVAVTKAPLWISLAVLILLFVGFMVWSAVTQIPVSSSGTGITVASGNEKPVEAPVSGIISTVAVTPGQQVTAGQQVATIEESSGQTVPVTAPVSGRVSNILVGPGLAVKYEQQLTSIYNANRPMQVFAYIPMTETTPIEPGMTTRVRAASTASDQSGYATGVVAAVTAFAVSSEQVEAQTGSKAFAESVTQSGPVREVAVALDQDSSSSDGNAHTTAQSAATPLIPGVLVDIEVITSWTKPINYIFPGF